MRRDYGSWITGYTDPKPHRYHAELKAARCSGVGIILVVLLRSVVEPGHYVEEGLWCRLDQAWLVSSRNGLAPSRDWQVRAYSVAHGHDGFIPVVESEFRETP